MGTKFLLPKREVLPVWEVFLVLPIWEVLPVWEVFFGTSHLGITSRLGSYGRSSG